MSDILDDLTKLRRPAVKVIKTPKQHPQTTGKKTRDAIKQVISEALEGQTTDITAVAKSVGRPDGILLKEAFINFETAVGGREELLNILQHCPPTSVGASLISKLMTDPAFTNSNAYALHTLCKKHRIPFNAVVQAFRDAKLAQIAINTLNQVADHVPEVVEQLVSDSTNRWEPCTICTGSGRIHRINEQGEFAFDSEGSALTQLCFDCRGKGKKYVRHDFSNRSKLLDLAGLRPDKGPLVQQTFNQQANLSLASSSFIPGDGSFESLMKAVEQTIKPTTQEGPTLDAEIIAFEATEPQETEPNQADEPIGVREVD